MKFEAFLISIPMSEYKKLTDDTQRLRTELQAAQVEIEDCRRRLGPAGYKILEERRQLKDELQVAQRKLAIAFDALMEIQAEAFVQMQTSSYGLAREALDKLR